MNDSGERKRLWPRYAAFIGIVLVLGGAAYEAYRLASTDDSSPKRKMVETVTMRLIAPPPPPPPPPVERPPEPQKMMEQPKIPENKPLDKPKEPDAPPPQLAVDAKGGAGSDSFGLAGRPGGSDLIGGSGGSGGGKFGWYAGMIQTQIQQALQKDERLRGGKYRVSLAVWLSTAGKPERVLVTRTTGNRELDELVQQALATMPPLPQAPPRDMPQPVSLRIDARPPQ